jgi:RimJ/RimL family protein N-acetyltransferase
MNRAEQSHGDLPGHGASVDAAATVYPKELERAVRLNDGTFVRIRPIRPDDEPRLVALYGRLSEHTAYQRFFTLMRRLPPSWFHFFANVDYRRRLALVAEHDTSAGLEVVGVGRYEPTDEEAMAELALVVEDGWQGRGLGRLLLETVLRAGQARGIRRFRAYVLAENERMLRLLGRHVDIERRKIEDGVVELTFTPRQAPSPEPPPQELGR